MNTSSEDDENDKVHGSKSKSVSSKKPMLKIKKRGKKKKLIFNELTLIEPHVETFYCLNEVNGAYKTVTAKVIDPDEECVKEWVHPDSQFVNKKPIGKYRPLELLNEVNTPVKNSGLIKTLFDDLNETVYKNEVTVLSPNKHKVYVEDTPVRYYGLSVLERRKKGLNN